MRMIVNFKGKKVDPKILQTYKEVKKMKEASFSNLVRELDKQLEWIHKNYIEPFSTTSHANYLHYDVENWMIHR